MCLPCFRVNCTVLRWAFCFPEYPEHTQWHLERQELKKKKGCTHPSKARLVKAIFSEGAILFWEPKSFQPQIDTPPPLRGSLFFVLFLLLFLFPFLLFPVFFFCGILTIFCL